ncbi:hypothetical protein RTBOTA2_006979 [Rhodotorula toruloides]|nr:hypothetical protein RTBOTA2_006979 [Rhodotorula toruloides]
MSMGLVTGHYYRLGQLNVHDLRRLGNVQLMSHIEFTVSTRLP